MAVTTVDFIIVRGIEKRLDFLPQAVLTGVAVAFNIRKETAKLPFITIVAKGNSTALGSTFTIGTYVLAGVTRVSYKLKLEGAETLALSQDTYSWWLSFDTDTERHGHGRLIIQNA